MRKALFDAASLVACLVHSVVCSQIVGAAFNPGDKVVIVEETQLGDPNNKAVDEILGRGLTFEVLEVERNWLWVTHNQTGRIDQKHVRTPFEAVEIFAKDVKYFLRDANAYVCRGSAWLASGEADIALLDYNEAIRLNQSSADAFTGRGNCSMAKGDPAAAICDYSQAIRLNPTSALAFVYRARAWNDKGDYFRALADCDEALRLNPTLVQSYKLRAWIYATSDGGPHDKRKAWTNARDKAFQLTSGRDPDVMDILAAVYADAKDFSKACEYERKAIGMLAPERNPAFELGVTRLPLHGTRVSR